MKTIAPTFITNREVDLFLGGGERGQRQRQRLRHGNMLPMPAELGRVQRFNIAVFPRFALAGLMKELSGLTGATACLAVLSRDAFRVAAFSQLAEAVRASAQKMDSNSWRFDLLVDEVGERAEAAVAEWDACIHAAETELQERFDIGFSTEFGVVESVTSAICIVSLSAGGIRRFPLGRMAAPMEKGRAVAIESVRMMGNEMNFVMPSTVDIPDAQDRELASWLRNMMTPAPISVAAPDDGAAEHLPYSRQSAPRRARWRGASTMTRVPSAS